MARRGGGYQQDPDLERAQLALMAAQTGQTQAETAATAQRMRLAAQELALRGQAETRAGEESRFKMGQETEMMPLNKLMALGRAGETASAERINRVKAAVDLLGLGEQMRQHEATLAAQTESQREARKTQLMDAFISHYPYISQLPGSAQETLAATLEGQGFDDYAKTLRSARAADIERKASALAPTLAKTKDVETQLSSLEPDLQDAVRKRLPAQQPVAPGSRAFELGQGVRHTIGAVPLVGPALTNIGQIASLQVPDVEKMRQAIKEFYSGLTQQ